MLKKKDDEKSKWRSEETIAKGINLRRLNTDDKDLSDMLPPEEDEEEIKDVKQPFGSA